MTDTSKLIEQAQLLANDQRDHGSIIIADTLQQCVYALQAKDAEIEDLKTRLAGCRAGFDRLARQVDGFSRAGKKADSWRKKP